MFENFCKMLTQLENVIDKGAHLVKELAPMARAFAPLAGPDAPAVIAGATAAEGLAMVVDTAIQEHQAGGNTPQSGIIALSTIAKGIADSDVTDDATAKKIKDILSAINPAAFGT